MWLKFSRSMTATSGLSGTIEKLTTRYAISCLSERLIWNIYAFSSRAHTYGESDVLEILHELALRPFLCYIEEFFAPARDEHPRDKGL